MLGELRREAELEFNRIAAGLLYLYRDPAHFQSGIANMAMLNDNGMTLQAVDPDRIVELEPQLAPAKAKLAGAIYAPTDESGDCLKFTERVAVAAVGHGVVFMFDHDIRRIEASGDRIMGVMTDKGRIEGDAYVLALGSYSPLLSRSLGVKLPIYPIKGYSLTLPIEDHSGAPVIGGVDEANLVAYARLGDRLRLTDAPSLRLETEIAALNEKLKPLTSFILPGGLPAAAAAHLTRTVVRRAERHVVTLSHSEAVNPAIIRYLNRLSDYLFVLSRHFNNDGAGDVLWIPGANR